MNLAISFAPGYFIDEYGVVTSYRWGRPFILKPWFHKGYPMVTLRVSNASQKWLVHRILGLVHIGFPPSHDYEIRHRDRNPNNCVLENIEWGTHAENMDDMSRHILSGALTRNAANLRRGDCHPTRLLPETVRRGEASSQSKLTEANVRAILARLSAGESQSAIARDFNVTNQLVWRIKNNRCWKHIERG